MPPANKRERDLESESTKSEVDGPPGPEKRARKRMTKEEFDDIMNSTLTYSDEFPDLPSNSSKDHARIVASIQGESAPPKLRAADAAVTLLFKYDPEALKSFLNASKKKVEWTRRENLGNRFELVLSREGNTVTFGYFEQLTKTWDHMVEYKVTKAGKGKRKPISATAVGLDYNVGGTPNTSYESKTVERFGNSLADSIVGDRKWEVEGESAQITFHAF